MIMSRGVTTVRDAIKEPSQVSPVLLDIASDGAKNETNNGN